MQALLKIWGWACDSAFLTSSQEMPVLPVESHPLSRNISWHSPAHFSWIVGSLSFFFLINLIELDPFLEMGLKIAHNSRNPVYAQKSNLWIWTCYWTSKALPLVPREAALHPGAMQWCGHWLRIFAIKEGQTIGNFAHWWLTDCSGSSVYFSCLKFGDVLCYSWRTEKLQGLSGSWRQKASAPGAPAVGYCFGDFCQQQLSLLCYLVVVIITSTAVLVVASGH